MGVFNESDLKDTDIIKIEIIIEKSSMDFLSTPDIYLTISHPASSFPIRTRYFKNPKLNNTYTFYFVCKKNKHIIKHNETTIVRRLGSKYFMSNELIFNLWDKDLLIDDNMLSFIIKHDKLDTCSKELVYDNQGNERYRIIYSRINELNNELIDHNKIVKN